jgi:prepilin-type N-terminal cleavage/methylation domain-containing protein
MSGRQRNTAGRRGGFSLTELLVVIVILAIAIVPMINAFAPARRAGPLPQRSAALLCATEGILNQALDLGYAELAACRSAPATVLPMLAARNGTTTTGIVHRGTTYTPTLELADAGGGTGGLIMVTVTLGDETLVGLKAQY